jgi:LmbE family N-acetylglucosaminyl deacetylase
MTQRILWVTPHQDDESLTESAAIWNHAAAKGGDGSFLYENHLLLLTTGENSAVRSQLALTREQFIAARDDEMMRAGRRLAFRFPHIHIGAVDTGSRVPDGTLTAATAAEMIQGYLAQPGWSDTWVKTLSDRPVPGVRHADHVAAGAGAVLLLSSGDIIPNGLRLYVEPYQLAAFRDAHPSVSVSSETSINLSVALDEYKIVGEVSGFYGIGYKSVKSAFDLVKANPTSYYHVPASGRRR